MIDALRCELVGVCLSCFSIYKEEEKHLFFLNLGEALL